MQYERPRWLGPGRWRVVYWLVLGAIWVAAFAALAPKNDAVPPWLTLLPGVAWIVAGALTFADCYWFDQDGVRTHRPLLVRKRQLAWKDVHRFENRGSWRGAGAWLNDGRWIKLRSSPRLGRSKVDREVALLEYIRQGHRAETETERS